MEEIFQVILQDIQADIEAFEKDDFENMNIFANRIMANAIFGNDEKLALPGFFLKHVALVFGGLKVRVETKVFPTVKSIGRDYLKSLNTLTMDINFDEKRIWEDFHGFNDKIRQYMKNEYEEKAYNDDPEFTRYTFKWLIRHLGEEKDVLLKPRNLFFKGLLNEMDRIYRIHGGKLIDTYTLSLVRAFERYYDYVKLACETPIGGIDETRMKELLFPHVDKIVSLLTSDEVKVEDVNSVLWELIRGWREFFIHYMEPRYAVEREVKLPEEAKKKLTETITKALEKEVK